MSPSIREHAESIAATARSGTAAVLTKVAKMAGDAASMLRPSGKDDTSDTTTAREVVQVFDERGEVKQRTQVTVPDVPAHAQVPKSHVAELAGGTVAQVTAAVPDLSTDELRMLLEHETANKNRKGVLDAIEQALSP
jgi:hypothetical protein